MQTLTRLFLAMIYTCTNSPKNPFDQSFSHPSLDGHGFPGCEWAKVPSLILILNCCYFDGQFLIPVAGENGQWGICLGEECGCVFIPLHKQGTQTLLEGYRHNEHSIFRSFFPQGKLTSEGKYTNNGGMLLLQAFLAGSQRVVFLFFSMELFLWSSLEFNPVSPCQLKSTWSCWEWSSRELEWCIPSWSFFLPFIRTGWRCCCSEQIRGDDNELEWWYINGSSVPGSVAKVSRENVSLEDETCRFLDLNLLLEPQIVVVQPEVQFTNLHALAGGTKGHCHLSYDGIRAGSKLCPCFVNCIWLPLCLCTRFKKLYLIF